MPDGYLPPVVATFTADTAEAVAAIDAYRESIAGLEEGFASLVAAAAEFDAGMRSMAESSKAASEALIDLRAEAIPVSEALQVIADDAKATSSAVQGLGRSTGTLTDRMTAGAESATAFGDELKTLVDAAEPLIVGLDEMKTAIAGLSASFGTLRAEIAGLASELDTVGTALAGTKAKAEEASGGFLGLGASAKELRSSLLMIGGALGITDYAAVKMASNFIDGMTRLQTEAGLSDAQITAFAGSMGNLQQQVIAIGNATGFTGTEMAKALYEPVSAGLSLGQALDVAKYSAEEARISGADLEETTTALTATMKDFGSTIASPEQGMADLNAIVGSGMMRFADFNVALKNWAPTAATFGVSLNSAGAALAYMTDRGESAQSAGTKLAQVMAMMVGQTNLAGQLMQGLGLSTDDVSASTTAMSEAMATAHIRTSTLAEDLRKPDGIEVALQDLKTHLEAAGLSADAADSVLVRAFGGGRQFKGLAELIQNLPQLKQKFDQISDDSNLAHFEEQWTRLGDTFKQQFADMKTVIENFGLELGLRLIPAATEVARVFADLFRDVDSNKAVIGALAAGFGVLAVALPVAAFGLFVTSLSSTTIAIGTLIGRIAMLSAGLEYGYTHLDSWSGALVAVVSTLGAVSTAISLLSGPISAIGPAFDLAKTAIGVFALEVKEAEGVMATLKVAAAGIGDFLLGPWGIALAAAAGAIAIFTSSHHEATKATQGLTDAIQQDSGAIGENTRKLIAHNLEQAGALVIAQRYGVQLPTLTDAVAGNKDAQEQLNAAIQQHGTVIRTDTTQFLSNKNAVLGVVDSNGQLSGSLDKASEGVRSLTPQAQQLTDIIKGQTNSVNASSAAQAREAQAAQQSGQANQQAGSAAKQAGTSSQNMAQDISQATSALNAAKQAAQGLASELDYLSGRNITAEQSAITLASDMEKLSSTIKSNSGNLNINTQAGRDDMTAILEVASAASKNAQDIANQTGKTDAGSAAFERNVTQLRSVLTQAGLTKSQVDSLIASYARIPSNITTTLDVNHPSSIEIPVYYDGVKSTGMHVAGGTITYAHGGLVHASSPYHFPDGGLISGPGTTTSDSIPAWVSDQEYVINAAAVQAASVPVLDAINSGDIDGAASILGAMSDGGSYGGGGGGTFGGGPPTLVNVTVNVNGSMLSTKRDITKAVLQAMLQAGMRNGVTYPSYHG